MKSYRHISFLFAGLLLVSAWPAVAQSIGLGSDITSRYVWRGFDFGESLSIQPSLAFQAGGFELGSWASYSISADGSGANEHDLYLSYSHELAGGSQLSVAVTDYYFPSPGSSDFFAFDGDGAGAHWIEPALGFSGPESFPVSLLAAMFVHNDPDNSLYLEAAYPFQLENVSLQLALGSVAGESAFYGTDGFALVNVSLSAQREIAITDQFALPVHVTYILNPDMERTYLVFGVSF